MVQDIKLYIDNELVDFDNSTDILYNWTETDVSNPTLTKNSYSKTITLRGTKNNNRIFGHFWNLERIQSYGNSNTGIYYNPSYRVPFKLYLGTQIFEQGYIKLENIKKEKGEYKYEIGLFGGLGTFFNNLSINYHDGSVKTLADLEYYDGDDPIQIGFNITKDTVEEAWGRLGSYDQWGVVNFAPTYNGTGVDNFDTDKVLINTNNISTDKIASAKTVDGYSYRTVDGFAMGSLENKIDMWEAKDIRSYMLTPVVRTKKIIEALTHPYNTKGEFDDGYEVVLDGEFFNDKNPYYNDTWMTLPKISTMNFGFASGSPQTISTWRRESVTTTNRAEAVTWAFPVSNVTTNMKAKISFNLRVYADSSAWDVTEYLYNGTNIINNNPRDPYKDYVSTCFSIQMYTTSSDYGQTGINEKVLNGSDIIFMKQLPLYYDYTYDEALTSRDITEKVGGCTIKQSIGGIWRKTSTKDLWYNDAKIELECDLTPNAKCVKLYIQTCNSAQSSAYKNKLYTRNIYGSDAVSTIWKSITTGITGTQYAVEPLNISNNNLDETTFYSNKYINKSALLTTPYSVADWLISYCKLFGLYIHKDINDNIIYIDTRNQFYKRDKITPLTLDYSKDIVIKPLAVENKFYSLTQQIDKSDSSKNYEDTYGKIYGTKVISTGYEFTPETKELLNIKLKGGVMANKQSIYNFKNISGINPYYFNGFKYSLYKGGQLYPSYAADNDTTTDIEVSKNNILAIYKNAKYDDSQPFADFVEKLDLEDGDKIVSNDGSNVLLFQQYWTDVSDYDLYLTDDLPIMGDMNNKPCWIMTNSEYSKSNAKIANKVYSLPNFTRYWLANDNSILYSLDFGSVRQFYVDGIINDDTRNLYSLFHKTYYEDLYNENTKVITCYIKNDDTINSDWLREFYWFDNGIWRINKVIDYNPLNNKTIKVELIKVQDVENYTNEVASTALTITLTLDSNTVPSTGGTIHGSVKTSDRGSWGWEDYPDDVTISAETQSTDSDIWITIPAYNASTSSARTLSFMVEAGGEAYSTATVTQPAVPYLSLTSSTQTIAASATNFSVTVVSNGSVRVSCSTGASNIYPSGARTIYFSIPQNTSSNPVTYGVTATLVNNAGITRNISRTQEGNVVTTPVTIYINNRTEVVLGPSITLSGATETLTVHNSTSINAGASKTWTGNCKDDVYKVNLYIPFNSGYVYSINVGGPYINSRTFTGTTMVSNFNEYLSAATVDSIRYMSITFNTNDTKYIEIDATSLPNTYASLDIRYDGNSLASFSNATEKKNINAGLTQSSTGIIEINGGWRGRTDLNGNQLKVAIKNSIGTVLYMGALSNIHNTEVSNSYVRDVTWVLYL